MILLDLLYNAIKCSIYVLMRILVYVIYIMHLGYIKGLRTINYLWKQMEQSKYLRQ